MDVHFLNKLKSVLKAKVTATDHEVSIIQPMQLEDEGLPMPSEILMKIFEYIVNRLVISLILTESI